MSDYIYVSAKRWYGDADCISRPYKGLYVVFGDEKDAYFINAKKEGYLVITCLTIKEALKYQAEYLEGAEANANT